MNEVEEREIDLMDLIWKLVGQWRPILLCMVIMAVVFNFGFYWKALLSYQESVKTNAIDEETLKSQLTDEEYSKVMDATTTFRYYTDTSNYVNNCPFVNMNLAALPVVSQQWVVRCDPEVMEPVTMAHLIATGLYSSSVAEAISEQLGGSVDVTYWGDTIYFLYDTPEEDSNESILTLRFVLTGEQKSENVANVLRSYISEHLNEILNTDVDYQVELLSSSETIDADAPVAASIASRRENIASYSSSLDTYLESLNDTQVRLYNLLTGESYTGVNGTVVTEKLQKPSAFQPKYAVIGMLFAAFVYAGIVFALTIFKGTLTCASDLESTYNLFLMDVVHHKSHTSEGWRRFVNDDRIQRLRYRNQQQNAEWHINHVTSQLRGLVEQGNYNEIHVLILDMQRNRREFITQYCELLRENWTFLDCQIVFDEPKDICETVFSLPEHAGIVLMAGLDTTMLKDISEIMRCAQRRNVPVLGGIVMDI